MNKVNGEGSTAGARAGTADGSGESCSRGAGQERLMGMIAQQEEWEGKPDRVGAWAEKAAGDEEGCTAGAGAGAGKAAGDEESCTPRAGAGMVTGIEWCTTGIVAGIGEVFPWAGPIVDVATKRVWIEELAGRTALV